MLPSEQRLQPIDLLKIYGDMEYEWDLQEDFIEWQGPFNRLLSPGISLDTGNGFGHLLSGKSFERRIQVLMETCKAQDPYYSVLYPLYLPHHEKTLVLEEGEIILKGGLPRKLRGYLCFKDLPGVNSPLSSHLEYSGYDMGTGLPERELMLENLACIAEQAYYTKTTGAYIALAVKQLNMIALQNSPKAAHEIFKQMTKGLRSILRKTDIIGRVSSTCLGIILQDCNQREVGPIVEDFARFLHTMPFELEDKNQYLSFSATGITFSETTPNIAGIMDQAEKTLFEEQVGKSFHFLPSLAGVPGNRAESI